MSFLDWIVSFGQKKSKPVELSAEGKKLEKFHELLKGLLSQDKFLARSDYNFLLDDYRELFGSYQNLDKTNTLKYFCTDNGIPEHLALDFLGKYKDLQNLEGPYCIQSHNESYIKRKLKAEKNYLDNILKKVDPVINLDEEQRKVVLSDEDFTLVIAGAGAGKTTTVAAKVKYLIEKKGVKPAEILVISFTNKAVEELKQKICKDLGFACPVTTFHSTGYAILRKQDEERKTIVEGGFMYNIINNYLKGNILENPELVDKLILFFGSYFDAPYEGADLNDFFNYITKSDFTTLKGNMAEYTEEIIDKRAGNRKTILHETLRSNQEVSIANFLFMNGIDYIYEKPYPFNIIRSHKPYTPDFTITQGDKVAYIEHFGITEDGKNSLYSDIELEKYKKAVNEKILLHRKHNTDLIYTFSSYKDGRTHLDHLQEQLLEKGFTLEPRPSQEIFQRIVSTEENRYISKLVNLICTFLNNFKTNGYSLEDFERFKRDSNNVRTKLFMTICEQCYHEYCKRLKEKNAIDFQDMINDSARILQEEQRLGSVLKFKYIIVDEYQDISRQRFNLTRELSKMCKAKIIAVGDDWQSIYAYAGSDITLFTDFCKTFGYGQELKITRTYRNAQELIDIAGGFVQKNLKQIKKALVSPKHIDNPVIIQTYTENVDRKQYEGKGGKFFLLGETVLKALDDIIASKPKGNILILGRFGFDAFHLAKYEDFTYDEKKGGVFSKKYNALYMDFMTVHRSKGLGYDNVIIINARNDVYGFPSKIQDDPVMKYVIKDDHSIDYAEERRLFYVALTRTKNRVYIVTPKEHPSEFVIELVKDYKNVKVRGEIDLNSKIVKEEKKCPICGYPLQLRYKKSYGLKLWICSNEPEICDFMTNNLKGRDLPIIKCDKCRDGYLVVKDTKNGDAFLGCTNYKPDNTGCNNRMTHEYYNKWKLMHR